MKLYRELNEIQQKQVFDNLQSLPLFTAFRNDTHDHLMASDVHVFDEKLGLHTLVEPINKVEPS